MPARKSRLGCDLDILGDSAVEPSGLLGHDEPVVKKALVMVNTRLDPELVAEARRVARLSGDTLTDVIREALTREVRRREKQLIARLPEEARQLEAKHASIT